MYAINRYILTVLVLVCLGGAAQAQDARTATLQWTCTESIDLRSDSTSYASFEIRTSASQITVKTGTITKVFTITSMTGTWADVDTDGSLAYQLQFGQKQGSATLARTDGAWTFLLDFSGHAGGIRQRFSLSGKQLIP